MWCTQRVALRGFPSIYRSLENNQGDQTNECTSIRRSDGHGRTLQRPKAQVRSANNVDK